jgi:hypothetical protein
MQHVEALGVRGVWVHEQQVFANRPGEKLRILGHEADAGAQPVEIDLGARYAVVQDSAGQRLVQADQQLHQGRLSRA